MLLEHAPQLARSQLLISLHIVGFKLWPPFELSIANASVYSLAASQLAVMHAGNAPLAKVPHVSAAPSSSMEGPVSSSEGNTANQVAPLEETGCAGDDTCTSVQQWKLMARIIYVPLLGEGRREKGEGRREKE